MFPFECGRFEGCSPIPFTYLQVWKSANNFINENLLAKCRARVAAGKSSFTYDEGKNHDQCKTNSTPVQTSITEFTFVRDPLSHFISGYTEAAQFTYQGCCTGKFVGTDKCGVWPLTVPKRRGKCPTAQEQGGMELAKEFLLGFLSADVNLIESPRHAQIYPEHFSLQAGILQRFHPGQAQFVGRLESLERDWNSLAGMLHLPMYETLDQSIGTHSSSKDLLGRRAALRRVLKAEPLLKHALQYLLELDYECFGYSV